MHRSSRDNPVRYGVSNHSSHTQHTARCVVLAVCVACERLRLSGALRLWDVGGPCQSDTLIRKHRGVSSLKGFK